MRMITALAVVTVAVLLSGYGLGEALFATACWASHQGACP